MAVTVNKIRVDVLQGITRNSCVLTVLAHTLTRFLQFEFESTVISMGYGEAISVWHHALCVCQIFERLTRVN